MIMSRIQVVNDGKSARISLSEFLQDECDDVNAAEHVDEAVVILPSGDLDVVVTVS